MAGLLVRALICYIIDKNAKTVVEENNTLSLVTSFIKRVDDVAAKSEATRVLTNLVKTVWVQKDNQELRKQIIEAQVIEPIIELIRTSTFPILKNDGLMALTLIFSDLESKDVLAQGKLQVWPKQFYFSWMYINLDIQLYL